MLNHPVTYLPHFQACHQATTEKITRNPMNKPYSKCRFPHIVQIYLAEGKISIQTIEIINGIHVITLTHTIVINQCVKYGFILCSNVHIQLRCNSNYNKRAHQPLNQPVQLVCNIKFK